MNELASIRALSYVIDQECSTKEFYRYAKPYVVAMSNIRDINENYYADTAESVVLYALGNLTSWRGETARLVKAQLKEHLKRVIR